MSKGAVLLATGTGAVGITGAGAYALGTFGDKSTLPPTLQDLKEADNLPCLNDYFPGLAISKLENKNNPANPKSKEITSKNTLETTFFNTTTSRHHIPKSCLMVNWNRDNYEGNKWKGNFKWLWTFVSGDQGFVMYNSFESNNSSTDFNVFGGVYFVQKDRTRRWAVHKYKEIHATPKVTQSDFDDKFPKAGTGLAEKKYFPNAQDYWGFVSGSSELSNICQTTDGETCTEEKLKTNKFFKGMWEWDQNHNSSGDLAKWVSNAGDWLVKMYSELSNFKSCLTSCFTPLKGKWINQALSGTDI